VERPPGEAMKPAAKLAPQPWMAAPETRAVTGALTAQGGEVRFVGGCVRDAVAGRPVRDIDIATADPPERVIALLEAAGLEAVPTGLAHGTVTAVSGGQPFEITTLREDVETFGRHARVAFTDDWEADAARRDFTFNAMSCGLDGSLYDPFGGRDDLAAGRVRFVGAAEARIREDYLRLLRFFRFHAHYGRGAPDPEGLAAARALAPQLKTLSGERLRNELLRLLQAPEPVAVCRVMQENGVLPAFLPEARSVERLAALTAVEPEVRLPGEAAGEGGGECGGECGGEGGPPDAVRRLAALLATDAAGAEAVAGRLRLSKAEGKRLIALAAPAEPLAADSDRADLRRAIHRHGRALVRDLLLLDWADRAAAGSSVSSGPPDRQRLRAALAELADWEDPAFPLQGRDALALGVPAGPAVGRLLRLVEDWWMAEDFQPDRDACLDRLKRLLAG